MRRIVLSLAVLLAVWLVMADSASAFGRRRCCRDSCCGCATSCCATTCCQHSCASLVLPADLLHGNVLSGLRLQFVRPLERPARRGSR